MDPSREEPMERSDLEDADLRHSDLRGANLEGAILQGADLTDVRVDAATSWPDGFTLTARDEFDRPADW